MANGQETSSSPESESESGFRLWLDASLHCVWVQADPWDARLGLPAAALLGKSFPELLVPEEKPAIVDVLESVREQYASASIVAGLSCDGEIRPFVLEVEAILGASNPDAALEISVRDAPIETRDRFDSVPGSLPSEADRETETVTSREVDEAAHFRGLIEQMRDGVLEVGGDGRIVYASPSQAQLLGVELEALLGSDPLDFVHADDRRRVRAVLQPNARVRRQPAVVYRALDARGEILHLETTARAFRAGGAGMHVVASTRDVSEREYARKKLERQIELETRVAELSRFFMDIDVDEIEAGIVSRLEVVADFASAQFAWMHSFTTGLQGMEIFGWPVRGEAAAWPTTAREFLDSFPSASRFIESGRVFHLRDTDESIEAAVPERRAMALRGLRSILGIPIMSAGQLVGCLGFASREADVNWSEETIMLLRMVGEILYSTLRRRRFVEDLRDSQSQLLQAQKMEAVGTLAGGIAHDFNNHLAVMLGNARYVRQEVDASPDVLEAIDDFERAADHCAELTRSLLAFSRRSPVAVRPVDVAELVRSVEGLVRPLLPAKIEFSIELGASLGACPVDRVQIQQVLVNLLVNARDAMPEGGPIRLSAQRRGVSVSEARLEGLSDDRPYVVLSVEDAGAGMDDETRERVFEPFFTTKETGEGTGLGLAMAYGIVQQSGGAIAIDSALGEGTTVRVFLPIHVDRDPVGSAALGTSEVILLEPDALMQGRLRRLLNEAGCRVEIAETPEQVTERVRRASCRCNLVIAASMRPELSADRFAEVLRGGDVGPPVLVLGSDAAQDAARRADVRMLGSPFDDAELTEAVATLLAQVPTRT